MSCLNELHILVILFSVVFIERTCWRLFTSKLNEMMAIWYSTPFFRRQPQRHFTYFIFQHAYSIMSLLNSLGSIQPPDAVNCRGLALSSCHHCLLPSTHSHLGRAGLTRVHSIPSHYCPSLRSPDSWICILVQSSIEYPDLLVQRPPIQVLTVSTVA